MKKLAIALCLLMGIAVMASAQDALPDSSMRGLFYKIVPSEMNIKDKIFIENASPFTILKAVIAVCDDNGALQPVAITSFVTPTTVREIADFDSNGLKRLRGCKIAIKVKGAKNIPSANQSTEVHTPFGNVTVRQQNVDQSVINNVPAGDVVYDFDAELTERNHDLYIKIVSPNSQSASIMDF